MRWHLSTIVATMAIASLPLSSSAKVDGYPYVDNETIGMFNALRDGLGGPVDKFDPLQWSTEDFEESLGTMLGLARYLSVGAAWATASLAEHLPAYRQPFVDALRRAVDRMLQQRAWGSWLTHYGDDPLAHDNLMYRGYLLFAMTLYQRLSGDDRYSEVVLRHADGRTFKTSMKELAESLANEGAEARNAQGEHHHGIACEPGQVFVVCNTQQHMAFLLYDQIYGTSLSEAAPPWISWLKNNMLEPQTGLFYHMYRPEAEPGSQLVEGVSGLFNAVTLVFLGAFDQAWADELYERFIKAHLLIDDESPYGPGTAVGRDGVFDAGGGLNEFATGFATTGTAMVATRARGDEALYKKLLAGWQGYLGTPRWNADGDRFNYRFPLIPLMFQNEIPLTARATTAEYTMAALVRRGLPDLELPTLEAVDEKVFVNQAIFDADTKTLIITVNGGKATEDPATLTIAGFGFGKTFHIERDGEPYKEWRVEGERLLITTPPLSATEETYRISEAKAKSGCACDNQAGGRLNTVLLLLVVLLVLLRIAGPHRARQHPEPW